MSWIWKFSRKYHFMLTLLTLRGSRPIWRPSTSLIMWSHGGLVSTVVGRVIFRPVLSYDSQRSWLAWVRRVGRGGLKSLFPPTCKAISSCFFILPGMARHQFPEPTPSCTYLALAWAAGAPGPGPCGLELSEKTQCRFLGFGGSFIETTCSQRLGRGHAWTFSALGRTATLRLVERLLEAIAIPEAFGNKIIGKDPPAPCLLTKVDISPYSQGSQISFLLSSSLKSGRRYFLNVKDCFICTAFLFLLRCEINCLVWDI